MKMSRTSDIKGKTTSYTQLKRQSDTNEKFEKKLCGNILETFVDKNTALAAKRMKELREIFGLHMTELAKKCDIHRCTIDRLEHERNKGKSDLYTYNRILEVLGVDIEDFVSEEENFDKWKFSMRAKYAEIDGLVSVIIKEEYSFDELVDRIFMMLKSDKIFIEDNGNKITLSENHIELLKRSIFNSFETVECYVKAEKGGI